MGLTEKVLRKRHIRECGEGGVGVSSWNDLSDKPFWENQILIEKPSDVSNCTFINSQPLEALGGMPFTFIKVSDNYFATSEETYGALLKVDNDGHTLEFTIAENHITDLGNGFGVLVMENGFYPLMMSVSSVGTSILPTTDIFDEDMIFNVAETGLYFLYIEGLGEVSSYTKDELKKIDKIFLPDNIQADWSQNDETALDYIKNKPFGDILVEKEYIFKVGNVTKLNGTNAYWLSCDNFNNDSLVAGQEYSIYYTANSLTSASIVWQEYAPTNGEKFIAEVDGNGIVYLGSSSVNGSYPFYFSSETCAVNYMWVNQFTYAQGVKLVGLSAEVTKLDEKYLPNQVQSDWSQSNPTQPDYIKNRPFSDHPYKLNGLPSKSDINIEPDSSVGYYYVSDLVPPDNMDYIFVGLGLDGNEYEVTTVNNYPAKNYEVYYIEESNYPYVIVTYQDNVQDTDILGRAITFPKMGVYFYYSPGGGNTVTSFMGGGITKIDKKFLPTTITVGDMDGDYAPANIFFKGRGYSFAKNDVKYEDGIIKLAHTPLITTEYYETYIESDKSIPNLNETVSITTTDQDIIKAIYDCYSSHHFLRAKVGFGGGETTYSIDFLIGQMWYSNPSKNTDGHITGMTCAIDGGVYTFQASFNNNRTSATINIKRVI